MARPTERIPFAGVDTHSTDPEMPTIVRRRYGVAPDESLPTFLEAVRSLPRATKLAAGYYDPAAEEWREAGHFVTLANPEWLGLGVEDAPRDDAVWSIPTVGYDLVNPVDAYGPLCATLRREGVDNVYGEIRVYRHGAEAHLDIFIPDRTVRAGVAPAATTFTLGLTSGYDFDQHTAHYARTIAHSDDGLMLRNLTKRRSRRSVKSRTREVEGKTAAELRSWWDAELTRMESAGEALLGVVADARDYTIEPEAYDAADFYTAQGLPETTLASSAADNLGTSEREFSAWEAYVAAATAVEEDFDGKDDGKAFRDHLRAVNRILFEPAVAESRALKFAADRVSKYESLTEGGKERLVGEIEAKHESLAEARATTKTLRDRLTEILEAADEMTDDEADDDESVEGAAA